MNITQGRGEFCFEPRNEGTVRVWYGDPNELGPEAEFVMEVHQSLIPDLIVTLKKFQDSLTFGKVSDEN